MTTARIELAAEWSKRVGGPLYVHDVGYEDDEWFLVQYGSRKYWVDKDPNFLIADPMLLLVNKESGKIERMAYLDDPDRIDAMREVTSDAASASG